MLGDSIEKATKAVGIKPCSGCQKRKEALNEAHARFDKGRRSFVQKSLAAAFLIKNNALMSVWKAVGATPPLESYVAIGLVRALNQIEQHHRIQQGLASGGYIDLKSALAMLIAQENEVYVSAPNTPVLTWWPLLQPNQQQILPGWNIYHAVFGSGQGYRLILAGPQETWISDEAGVIYNAPTPSTIPDPASLADAAAFPNSTPLGVAPTVEQKPPTFLERFQSYFRPVYAQGGCSLCTVANCSHGATCCNWCLAGCSSCGSFSGCSTTSPTCACFFNPGCLGCPWYETDCSVGSSGCTQCAEWFSTHCCCLCSPHNCGGG